MIISVNPAAPRTRCYAGIYRLPDLPKDLLGPLIMNRNERQRPGEGARFHVGRWPMSALMVSLHADSQR
jgi:hypothetical protein